MDMKDILSLANAGFTAKQIGALVQTTATPPVVATPPVATPPVTTPPVTDPIMAEIAKLTSTLQANALMQAQQPQTETTEDILANIINPPTAEGGKK